MTTADTDTDAFAFPIHMSKQDRFMNNHHSPRPARPVLSNRSAPSSSLSTPSTLSPLSLLTLVATAVLAGCTVTPKVVTTDEVKARVQADAAVMYRNQVPITAAVSLEEAVARSLKYNLDYRLKRMESALALGLTAQASMDTLPSLVASAGYRSRTNDSGGTNYGILDGAESTNPTSSEERSRSNAGLEFSWNALDFGVSYYRARQQANQYLIAEERRRKVVHNILQDVRGSYWRALGAQRLNTAAEQVLERAQMALGRSREAETQRAISPALALNYQRALLDATTLLNQRRQDLQVAKRELAALMNSANLNFTLAETPETALPSLPTDAEPLETMALMQRPELREEDLRTRVTTDEARKQLLGLLPNLSFNIGARYDSNKYSYNQGWGDGGLSLAWNLLRWASYPAMQEAQRAQVQTDEARRAALSMAVLTQTRVSVERYRLALEDFKLADSAAQVDRRLATYTRATVTAKLDSELEAVRTQARAVLGEYQRANAFANAHIAFARLYNSLGFDALADDVENVEIPELAAKVKAHLQSVDKQAFAMSTNLHDRPVYKVALTIHGVTDAMQHDKMMHSAQTLLARHQIMADPAGTPLAVHLSQRPDQGLQRATWHLRLMGDRAGDKMRGETSFNTTFPTQARASLYESSLSAALAAKVGDLRSWLAAK